MDDSATMKVDQRQQHFDQQFNLHRSEEHTSELQSHSDLVCRLLLEKKQLLFSFCSTSVIVISYYDPTNKLSAPNGITSETEMNNQSNCSVLLVGRVYETISRKDTH